MLVTVEIIDYQGNTSTVQYDDSDAFNEGLEAKLYFTPDKTQVVKIYKPKFEKSRKNLAEILQARPADDNPVSAYLAWPTAIVIDPNNSRHAAGVVMPNATLNGWLNDASWYISSKKFFSRPVDQQGDFRGRVQAAICMTYAVRYLNGLGFSHADLSSNNFLANPVDGRAVLIDLDGLIVPNHMGATVAGTPGYMAPELVVNYLGGGEVRPTPESDRHALAVVLYEFLLMRHPLLGGNRPPLDPNDADRDNWLRTGDQAVYIEHSTNTINRPKDFYISAQSLGQTKNDIHDLFRLSFEEYLFQPAQRPRPFQYESALKKLCDDLVVCKNPDCDWKQFPGLDQTAVQCPICEMSAPTPPPLGFARVLVGKEHFYPLRSSTVHRVQKNGLLTREQVFDHKGNASPALEISLQSDGKMVVIVADSSVTGFYIEPRSGYPHSLDGQKGREMSTQARLFIACGNDKRLVEFSPDKKW